MNSIFPAAPVEIVRCQRLGEVLALHAVFVIRCFPDILRPDLDLAHRTHGDQLFFDACIVLQLLRDTDTTLLIEFTFRGVGAEVTNERTHLRIGFRQLRDFFHLFLPVLHRIDI